MRRALNARPFVPRDPRRGRAVRAFVVSEGSYAIQRARGCSEPLDGPPRAAADPSRHRKGAGRRYGAPPHGGTVGPLDAPSPGPYPSALALHAGGGQVEPVEPVPEPEGERLPDPALGHGGTHAESVGGSLAAVGFGGYAGTAEPLVGGVVQTKATNRASTP